MRSIRKATSWQRNSRETSLFSLKENIIPGQNAKYWVLLPTARKQAMFG